jgi:2-haloacid dehalogenase
VAEARQKRSEVARAVLWDLGGVLLDWDPRYLYGKLFGSDVAAMDDFLAHVCSPAWHAAQDLGAPTARACAELAEQHPAQAGLINAWAERNEEMVRGAISGSVEVLAELRDAGVACYALSNMEKESWHRRRGLYEFLSWFDGCFISALEGVMKPDPRYFRRALARFGLEAGDCLFIDDRAENTEVARALGIPAVLFRSPGALREELVARSLLP